MILHISSALLDAIFAHAASDPAREICGLLFGEADRIVAAQPTANVHPEPARHFEVDPADLIAAHKADRAGGRSLIGAYHSHPGGVATPSAEDVAGSENGRLSLIVAGADAQLYLCVNGAFQPVAMIVAQDPADTI